MMKQFGFMIILIIFFVSCGPHNRTYKYDLPASHYWFDDHVKVHPILNQDDKNTYNAFVTVINNKGRELIPVFPILSTRLGAFSVYKEYKRNRLLNGFSFTWSQVQIPIGENIQSVRVYICKLPNYKKWKILEIPPNDSKVDIRNFKSLKNADLKAFDSIYLKAEKEYSRVQNKR